MSEFLFKEIRIDERIRVQSCRQFLRICGADGHGSIELVFYFSGGAVGSAPA